MMSNDLRIAALKALAKLEHLWEIGIDAEYRVELLPEIEALRQAIEQAEKQEPAATRNRNGMIEVEWGKSVPIGTKLYTAPPSKPWVGLHLDDMPEEYAGDRSFLDGAKWAEAKLRSKNGY
jgi:hypothetical protein